MKRTIPVTPVIPQAFGVDEERPSSTQASSNPSVDKMDIKEQIQAEMESKKAEQWRRGAEVAVRADLANTAAQDVYEAEQGKKEAYKQFERALGVDLKRLMAAGACSQMQRALPKMMFLMIIVGCELDYYGFLMSFSSYWVLNILPLKVLLITAPLGFCMAVGMFFMYAHYQEPEKGKNKFTLVRHVTNNPLKPDSLGAQPVGMAPLKEMINDHKEPIHLKFYHFLPLVRYYLIIKDQNASDVEGLFRVNSLSSFTLGVAQLCGIAFTSVAGEEMDFFVKINIGSQIINWLITILYFSTQISNRMKASFKVDTLFYNSTIQLRKEYESYLNCTTTAAAEGGGDAWQAEINKFHHTLNLEISEFVKQDIDLSVFSMEEKYKMRQAIRKKMYATYMTIK